MSGNDLYVSHAKKVKTADSLAKRGKGKGRGKCKGQVSKRASQGPNID